MNGLLYGLLCLIWGSTWAGIKFGIDGVPPLLGAGLRFALAAAVLAPMAWARPRRALTPDDKAAISSCGFMGFTVSYAAVYWAEQYIASGLTAILYCTMPLFVAVLSAYWTKAERLGARTLAGIGVGMAGTVILFWPAGGLERRQCAGMLAALAGSLASAVNLVTMKKRSRHTDIYVLNCVGMAIGSACLLGLSALSESYSGLRWSQSNVIALVYLSLFGSVAAFLSYYHLIKTMDATPLSLISLIIPIVAVVLGWAFLGEKVTAATGAGIATILAGVCIAVLPARRPKTPAQPAGV
ncbi:MAG: EamA family transporter [Elusimicrobia bacterium]|nr:EamA family transporter [Elusimicrobiota bacterium]